MWAAGETQEGGHKGRPTIATRVVRLTPASHERRSLRRGAP